MRAGLVYWHEKYIYFRHVVEREGQPAAVGIARIAILNRAGRVRPSEALAELGHPVAAPAIPPVIESLQRSEKLMRQW